MSALPQLIDENAPLFTVTVAAKLAGMHPQTLRAYDRMGLVVPKRTKGRGRRYSRSDVKRLRIVQQLSHDEGINLNGIIRILDLQDQIERLEKQLHQLAFTVEQLQAVNHRAGAVARVFTAESSGTVHLGRRQSYRASLLEITKG